MLRVDLNCDLGESTALWPYNIENDVSLLDYISSINIACGSHAGDQATAQRLIQEAKCRKISIGAHPSFPDKDNFGRKAMNLSENELYSTVCEQIELIADYASSLGKRIQHVKLHGALYNMATNDHRYAHTVCSAIQSFDKNLLIYALSGSKMITVADEMGMRTCSEVFADRIYQDNGTLMPRTEIRALIMNTDQCIQQVLQMVLQGNVTSVKGNSITVNVETICIHSDNVHALAFAKAINELLHQHGIDISHP